jgi:hypothetical protein
LLQHREIRPESFSDLNPSRRFAQGNFRLFTESGYKREKPVLDLVPFACSWRQMGDRNFKAGFVGQLLKLPFPKTHPGDVAATRVRGEMEAFGRGVTRFSEPLPPAADAFDGKSGSIAADTNIHPPLVGGDAVDTVGGQLAQFLDFEIVNAYRLRVPTPGAA